MSSRGRLKLACSLALTSFGRNISISIKVKAIVVIVVVISIILIIFVITFLIRIFFLCIPSLTKLVAIEVEEITLSVSDTTTLNGTEVDLFRSELNNDWVVVF